MRASQYTETTDNEEQSIRTFLVDLSSDERSIENSRRVFKVRLEETITKLKAAGKQVILIGQVPMLRNDPVRCMENSRVLISKIYKKDESHCFEFDEKFVDQRLKYSRDLYLRLAEEYDISYLEPSAFLPSARIDSQMMYFDDNHINVQGATMLGNRFDLNDLMK